jgi:hypothetical protein
MWDNWITSFEGDDYAAAYDQSQCFEIPPESIDATCESTVLPVRRETIDPAAVDSLKRFPLVRGRWFVENHTIVIVLECTMAEGARAETHADRTSSRLFTYWPCTAFRLSTILKKCVFP